MLNKYGYEITNNKKELEEELAQAVKKYGNDILILNDIEVVSVKDLAKDTYFQYFVDEEEQDLTETHVFIVSNTSMWWGYLTGLVLSWYTDEDFESGVFEEETFEALYLLKNLNKFMEDFKDRNWDIEASNKRIDELEKSLD